MLGQIVKGRLTPLRRRYYTADESRRPNYLKRRFDAWRRELRDRARAEARRPKKAAAPSGLPAAAAEKPSD